LDKGWELPLFGVFFCCMGMNNNRRIKMFDFAVIGGGVTGALTARALTAYENSVVIIEKEHDVAMGQSKANSGIIHAGYDPEPGSLKAVLNVKGAAMMEQLCRQLDVKYRKNGALVTAFSDEDMSHLQVLLERGRKNGVEGLQILSGEDVRRMEKNLSEKITGALYAPSSAVVCPYELTIHAAGNAMDNGAELFTGFEVCRIEKMEGFFRLYATDGRTVDAGYVINCAGINADEVAAMAGDDSFRITGRKGEYLLLDKETKNLVGMTIFKVPDAMGKGVLATRTADGNILLGPTSEDCQDKEDTSVTAGGMEEIIKREYDFFGQLPLDKVITQFTGVRSHGDTGDFIINNPLPGFINVAGIESPGLSSSPAIAEMVTDMLREQSVLGRLKEDFNPEARKRIRLSELTTEEKNRIIETDPSFGHIVCRCEEITEGEIIQAVRMNPPATDVDGVKRRTRAGMGRCQGGFCMPSVAEIISRELGIPFEEVTKKGGDSRILYGRTGKGGAR